MNFSSEIKKVEIINISTFVKEHTRKSFQEIVK